MAVRLRGFITFDEAWFDDNSDKRPLSDYFPCSSTDAWPPLQDQGGANFIAADHREAAGPHSRGGASYTEGRGGSSDPAFFDTATGVWIGHAFPFKPVTVVLPSSGTTDRGLYWNHSGGHDNGPVGQCRVRTVTPSTGGVQLQGQVKTGAPNTWSTLFTSSALTVGTQYWVLVETNIDPVTAANRQLRLHIYDSSGEIASSPWTASNTNITQAQSMPAFYNYLIAGKTGQGCKRFDLDEGLAWDWDAGDTAPTYGMATSQKHCFAIYPDGDGDDDTWTAVGTCDLNDKWRGVDDVEDAAPWTPNYPDYCYSTGAGLDQLFTLQAVGEAGGGTTTIDGVYVFLSAGQDSVANIPTFILTKLSGEKNTHAGILSTQTFCRYKFFKDKTGIVAAGGAWTLADVNALQVGARGDLNNRLGSVTVGIVGEFLARPVQNAGCPAAGGRRRFAMVAG